MGPIKSSFSDFKKSATKNDFFYKKERGRVCCPLLKFGGEDRCREAAPEKAKSEPSEFGAGKIGKGSKSGFLGRKSGFFGESGKK